MVQACQLLPALCNQAGLSSWQHKVSGRAAVHFLLCQSWVLHCDSLLRGGWICSTHLDLWLGIHVLQQALGTCICLDSTRCAVLMQLADEVLRRPGAVHAFAKHAAQACPCCHMQRPMLLLVTVTQSPDAFEEVMETVAVVKTPHPQPAALHAGAAPEVADAIFDSVLPRRAGDLLPHTQPGLLAACADRLDSIVGLIAAGCAPSSQADPFGVRRDAYALLQVEHP